MQQSQLAEIADDMNEALEHDHAEREHRVALVVADADVGDIDRERAARRLRLKQRTHSLRRLDG